MLRLPAEIRSLLRETAEEPEILGLAARVRQLLVDNKTPFFPDYTDHGLEHAERVLADAVRLVPKRVWSKGLLTSTDVAVLCGAVLLHDLGMHIREPGFLELISTETDYRPLPWFRDVHGERPADRDWPTLWERFRNEARHLTSTQLEVLLGRGHHGVPPIAYDDQDCHPERWTDSDRLLIGEFIRRHHARLAHEIAIRGFPGARDLLPALTGGALHADAIGLVARSHGEALRTAIDYLEWDLPGSRRPHGAVLPYLMALLRVADYLQIDASRAPPLLLRLRQPQARASIEEWNKHGAVVSISWEDQDPLALHVEVRPEHGLRTHQQLRELIRALQAELDTSSAVIRELYPHGKLAELKISRQRVRTNLVEASLHERMAYVPRPARLHSGEDLFRLLVSELYGDQPVVGGRELLQNAVDAVRERHRWEADQPRGLDHHGLGEDGADVVLSIIESETGPYRLRVCDRGIGMTPEVVIDYFLAAGASFGPPGELLERAGARKAREWLKAGRFGVGAFAAFLIGAELRVETRHVNEERGISFSTRLDADLIELRWADVPVGTSVEVLFGAESLLPPKSHTTKRTPSEQFLTEIASFYSLKDPSLQLEVVAANGEARRLHRQGIVPTAQERDHEWQELRQDVVDSVLWISSRPSPGGAARVAPTSSNVAHNGLEIRHPAARASVPVDQEGYTWRSAELALSVRRPYLAVFDSQHRLGLTLTRYELRVPHLPFERELSYAIGLDVAAHALTKGECQYPYAPHYGLVPVIGSDAWFPLSPSFCQAFLPDGACVIVVWHALGLSSSIREARTLMHVIFEQTREFPQRYCLMLGVDAQARGRVPETEIRAAMGCRAIEHSRDGDAASVQVVVDGLVAARPKTWDQQWWGADLVSTFVRHPAGAPAERVLEPLTVAWQDTIGGPLTRDPARRAGLAAELRQVEAGLDTYLDKWAAREV